MHSVPRNIIIITHSTTKFHGHPRNSIDFAVRHLSWMWCGVYGISRSLRITKSNENGDLWTFVQYFKEFHGIFDTPNKITPDSQARTIVKSIQLWWFILCQPSDILMHDLEPNMAVLIIVILKLTMKSLLQGQSINMPQKLRVVLITSCHEYNLQHVSVEWRNNECDVVSNHQSLDWLLNSI